MDKVLEGILKEVSDEMDISIEEVERVLKMPYKQMRHHIMELELKGKMAEDIEGVKTNFNMPSLFKLYLNKKKLNKLNTKEQEL